MSFALPLAAGAVGQSLATDLAWTVASNYSISTATFDAIIGAGFIAGAALAGAFLAPGLPGTEGPRVMDGMGQVSTYGKFLPVLYGRNRIAGNVIWSKGIREVATTTESGGKGGGGGSSSTSYTYYCSWAVGLCEGKVRDIHKIWFDFDLVYEQNGSVNGAINDKTTFYYGTDDQTADPLMQAAQGATDTPAYRGVSYIVFNDILLSDWNNRIPNITVELSRFPDVGETSNIYPVEMDIDGYNPATSYTNGLIRAINTYVTMEPDQLLSSMQVDNISTRSIVISTSQDDQLLSNLQVDAISTKTVVISTSQDDQLLSNLQVDAISTKTVVISTSQDDQLLSSLQVNDIVLVTV